MRRMFVGCMVLGLVSAGGAAVGVAFSPAVSDPPMNLKLVPEHAHRNCDGDLDTLTWDAPADTGGQPLLGYHVEEFDGGFNPPHGAAFDVGPDVTSLPVTPEVGPDAFSVFADTSAGRSERAITTVFMDGVPSPQSFDFTLNLDSVKRHAITTSASWFAQTKIPGVGGDYHHATVKIVISPGGESQSYEAHPPGEGVPVTFTGLKAGVQYHFTAVVKNKCGKATATSRGFTTGTDPQFFHATPPLSTAAGDAYRYRFGAKGTPTPTYSLVGAPPWLDIDAVVGLVSGTPPGGTQSFTFGVSARNTFGIEGIPHPAAMAGPFVVTVDP